MILTKEQYAMQRGRHYASGSPKILNKFDVFGELFGVNILMERGVI